jgi:AcrR family transcriptional regulator
MAAAVGEKGFARATVADAIAGAGVSRETFYEQFSDKEECFLAALETGADGLAAFLGSATRGNAAEAAEADPLARLERMLGVYLSTLAAAPGFAKAFLIDAYGAGPRATRLRIELQQRFVDQIAMLLELDESESAERFACEALVAAISSLVTARVGTGRADELPSLREPLVELARRLSLVPVGG